MIAEGRDFHVPQASELSVIARLLKGINSSDPQNGFPIRPDVAALHRLVLLCHERTEPLPRS